MAYHETAQASLAALRKQYEIKSPAINAQVQALMAEVDRLEQEIDEILMDKISHEVSDK